MSSAPARLFAAAALLGAAANADYLLQEVFAAPGCPAGTAYQSYATNGAIYSAGASGGIGVTPGCALVTGTNFYSKTVCTNASYAVVSYYNTMTCQGAAFQTSPITGLSWGCTAQGSSSTAVSCATGTFAPANTALRRSYSNPTRCSNSTVASVAPSQVVGTPLGCVASPGVIGAGSTFSSCNA